MAYLTKENLREIAELITLLNETPTTLAYAVEVVADDQLVGRITLNDEDSHVGSYVYVSEGNQS